MASVVRQVGEVRRVGVCFAGFAAVDAPLRSRRSWLRACSHGQEGKSAGHKLHCMAYIADRGYMWGIYCIRIHRTGRLELPQATTQP